MRKINLDILKEGQIGLSSNVAAFYLEALVYCLMTNGHFSGVLLKVTGEFEETFELIWSDNLTEQIKQSWNDQSEAAEYGATGIAILLTRILLNFEILQRNVQSERTDYKIGFANNLAINSNLEVSGIFSETKTNSLIARVNKKIQQVKKRKDILTAYVIVTEFSKPKSKIVKDE